MWNQDCFIINPKGRPCVAIALIEGIGVNGTGLKIGPIIIRKFSDSDKKFFPEDKFLYNYSLLELHYLDHLDVSSMYCKPLDIIEKSFYALQLSIDNWIGLSHVIFIDKAKSGNILGKVKFSRGDICDAHMIDDVDIASDDKKFVKLFKIIYDSQRGDFTNVINRYSKACSEIALESIVDFMIALEGTLGYKLNTEIAHRISSRGSLLLARDKKERVNYYKIIKYLYNLRSKIVHGNLGDIDSISDNMKEILSDLGFIVENKKDSVFAVHDRYFLANITRQITRSILLKFITGDAKLNEEWLLGLDLGMV